jgi:hypothetical protein
MEKLNAADSMDESVSLGRVQLKDLDVKVHCDITRNDGPGNVKWDRRDRTRAGHSGRDRRTQFFNGLYQASDPMTAFDPNSPINAALVLSDCRHWFSNVACCKQ